MDTVSVAALLLALPCVCYTGTVKLQCRTIRLFWICYRCVSLIRSHPGSCVRFMQHCMITRRYETTKSYYILMEYIMGGTLRSVLQAMTCMYAWDFASMFIATRKPPACQYGLS